MKNLKHVFLAVISAATLSFFTSACDRTVSQTEDTKVKSDGTVKSKETTVTEHPDGTVSKTEETKKTEPANP